MEQHLHKKAGQVAGGLDCADTALNCHLTTLESSSLLGVCANLSQPTSFVPDFLQVLPEALRTQMGDLRSEKA
jgi:hypothetical protein